MTSILVPFEPTFIPSKCVIHNKQETYGQKYYHQCWECGHVFNEAIDLVNEHNSLMDTLNKTAVDGQMCTYVEDADQVYCCPFCAHDF